MQCERMDAADERNLLLRAQRGDRRAADELVKSHMGLVHKEARRHAWTGIPRSDLVSEGVIGLLEAIRRFDTTRTTRLSTYALWWIRAAVWDFVWRNRRIVSIPSTRSARKVRVGLFKAERALERERGEATTEALAELLGVPEQDLREVRSALTARDVWMDDEEDPRAELPSFGASPERHAMVEDQRAHVRAIVSDTLERLPARERTIVERRLLSEDRPSLAALGDELGVSRERVRQLQRRAETVLREALSCVA